MRLAMTICGIGIAALLASCREEEPEASRETPPRPIKVYTVAEVAGTMVRRFTAVSEPSESAALSFPVSGSIVEVPVSVGTSVAAGDLIARLDPEPFELEIAGARAEVERLDADLETRKGDLERAEALFARKWIALAAIEKSRSAFESANGALAFARSRLSIAERNLASTTLIAPYTGNIARRPVDAFEEVSAGQTVVEINSTDGMRVSFSVPEIAISDMSPGQTVDVSFSAFPGQTLEARIIEVETAASAGNAYTARASLSNPPEALRPGMTAIVVAGESGTIAQGYFVPLTAIAPGEGAFVGSVFRYDPADGVVRQVPIRGEGVQDNLVIVTEGVEPGDVLAAAGVSFLMDGQAVRLLEE